jgi:hypothetical protein
MEVDEEQIYGNISLGGFVGWMGLQLGYIGAILMSL